MKQRAVKIETVPYLTEIFLRKQTSFQ